MESLEMEQLAFIITKNLGVDKSDIDLLKSIREANKSYLSAVRQISSKNHTTKIIKSPI